MPKEIRAIREPVRHRIREAITSLASNPIPIGASRIRGRTNAYRIRVAACRIVYEVHVTEIVVYVVRVGHRREVYRRILQRN